MISDVYLLLLLLLLLLDETAEAAAETISDDVNVNVVLSNIISLLLLEVTTSIVIAY